MIVNWNNKIMWILITLLSIFIITSVALAYACLNLLKKVEVYENWADTFRGEVNQMYYRLKAVDEKNLFEKDDDVGQTFSEIVRICKEFNETVK